jgi:Mg/Co/Ni transporter MgtE
MAQELYQGRTWHCVVHRDLLNELRLAAAMGDDRRPAVDRALLRRLRAVFTMEHDDEDIFRARAKLGLFKAALTEIHPADLAAALPEFDSRQRSELFGDLPTGQASGTLEEVEPQLQRELVAALSIERVAELIDFMTPAQAAAVLRNLTRAESWAIIQQLGPMRSRKIAALLEKRDSPSLLALATLRYVRAEPERTAAELLADYRRQAQTALVWRYVYVVAADGVLLGIADLRDILLAPPDATLSTVMMTNVVSLQDCDDADIADRLLGHYGFDALPVVDGKGVMMGVVAARDLNLTAEW